MHAPRLAVLSLASVAFAAPAVAQDSDAEPAADPPPYVTLTDQVVTERTETSENVERRTPLVPRSEKSTTVTLGPRVVEIRDEDGPRLLLDYEAGRSLVVDDAAGTYHSTPLLAHVGFLEIEMLNRRKLGGVLEATGTSDPAFEPLEVSILFGWPDPRDASDIESDEPDGGITWRVGDDELTHSTWSEHLLDEAQGEAFGRFLQWRCNVHWEIREEIVDDGRAPAVLRYRWYDTGRRSESTWTLTSCVRTAEPPAGVEGLDRAFDDDAVGRLARRVLEPADDLPERLDPEKFARLAAEARQAGRPVDAMLLLLESSLQDNADVRAPVRELLADEDDAASVRGLIQSIGRANEEPEQGLAELDAIDRTRLTHPAILDVFRANGLARLGRTGEALEAFESALTELPWLTSAYNDLGGVLHRSFRADDAWLAWEIGRTVGPDHPNWRGIEALEMHLRKTYAELL